MPSERGAGEEIILEYLNRWRAAGNLWLSPPCNRSLMTGMRRINYWTLAATLWVVVTGDAAARTVRLLTIGNSFSRNATHHLPGLVTAGGHELIHHPIIVGGASLELHATKAQAHEAGPKDKAGLYKDGSSLRQRLQEQPWDFDTVQQASIKSHDPATYQPFGPWLAGYVRQHAPTARLLVHQTWAYRADDPRFTKPSNKPGEPATRADMHTGLTAAYEQLAAEINAGLLPVGDAFNLAETDPRWGYQADAKFDFKTAKPPALPDQTHSLHVGWRWKKQSNGQQTLGMDGHHAGLAGEYLGACVWYEVLFEESCVDLDYVPSGLDTGYARFLRETAHRAVSARKAGTASTAVKQIPGLAAFWDFQEPAGQPRAPSAGDPNLLLQEQKGPVERVDGGVFGPYSARIKSGQWLMIERPRIGALDIHGSQAEVTVAAWIWREGKSSWQAITGVWDETRKKRQYCLFLNAPRGTRADEMVRYPLANRIHGHVSAIGGPTPGDRFCITYSSGATEIPFGQWVCLALRYDGRESRVYVNGRLDALEHYNPFPFPDGLFEGGADGADFTVGAVHRGGEWGNFFSGRIAGLAVFTRALSDDELALLGELGTTPLPTSAQTKGQESGSGTKQR